MPELESVARCANCGRFVPWSRADGYTLVPPGSSGKEQVLFHDGADCDDITTGAD